MAQRTARTRLVIIVAVCAAVILGLGLVARTTEVTTTELDVFRWFNGWPQWPARPLWLVMQLGSVIVALVLGALVMGLLRGRTGALAAFTAVASAWLLARLVKVVVDRGRPADYLATIDTRFEHVLRGGGYVSGHTAVAFALAALVAGSLSGLWRLLPYALAAAVGVARLYFGAHLPLDVVGGAALGLAVGLVTRSAFGLDRPRRVDRAPGEHAVPGATA